MIIKSPNALFSVSHCMHLPIFLNNACTCNITIAEEKGQLQDLLYAPLLLTRRCPEGYQEFKSHRDNVVSPSSSQALGLLAYSAQLTNRAKKPAGGSPYLSAPAPFQYQLQPVPPRCCCWWSGARLPQTAGSPPPACRRGAGRRRSWRR